MFHHLLGLCWNVFGAFLGSVTSKLQPPPQANEKDTRSLIFKDFLAAPLLSTKGLYTEKKFSGCNEAGDNNDLVGHVVDAYAHHILINSSGTFLMTDLQGMLFFFHYSFLLIFYILGVVGPDKEIILYDPQVHS